MDRQSLYMLVIANSARMLAQAARLAGFKPLVIDLYGDQDTVRYAEAFQKAGSLAAIDLNEALDTIIDRYPVACAVYGCGFECYPDSLRMLADRLALLGNSPEVFALQHDKRALFSSLDMLGIPHPDVQFFPPDCDNGWLVKSMQGFGGTGIRKYLGNDDTGTDTYWQRFQKGVAHSVLFLANGKQSQIVGFNRQWTTRLDGQSAFVFAGVINHTWLTDGQKAKLVAWLEKLVPAFSLKGLNSLDFIQDGEDSYVLEINPRPPASMQLYVADLFIRHINACNGELADLKLKQSEISGYQIVYAQQNLLIPEGFQWPQGIHDIPQVNTRIGIGQPICSMITRTHDPDTVMQQLHNQQISIINALDRFQTHGI